MSINTLAGRFSPYRIRDPDPLFKGIMKRGLTGPQNRVIGQSFEDFLELQCRMKSVLFIKMPLGCRRVGKNRLIPISTPFDYTIIKDGVAAFLDCKSFTGSRVSHSMLTEHQVSSLYRIQEKGCRAGYIVWHRDINRVVFYSAEIMFKLRRGESLGPDDGLILGPCESFSIERLVCLSM